MSKVKQQPVSAPNVEEDTTNGVTAGAPVVKSKEEPKVKEHLVLVPKTEEPKKEEVPLITKSEDKPVREEVPPAPPKVEKQEVESSWVDEAKEDDSVKTEEYVEDIKTEATLESLSKAPVVSGDKTENEHSKLIRELNVKPQGVNMTTGRPIYPSTPILRAMKERQEREVRFEVKTIQQLTDEFIAKHGPQVMNIGNVKFMLNTMGEYIYKMSPENAIDEQRGGELQSRLAKMYDVVLGSEPEVSLICLEYIVSVVKANINLSFSERHALRFINTMRVSQEQSYRFQMLTTLFIELAKGASNETLAQVVNVRKLLDFITDRNAKANLSEFLA